jgi:DNA-nicking Smr family endonuclease
LNEFANEGEVVDLHRMNQSPARKKIAHFVAAISNAHFLIYFKIKNADTLSAF